jgi:hypothetical protein
VKHAKHAKHAKHCMYVLVGQENGKARAETEEGMTVHLTRDEAEILIATLEFAEGAALVMHEYVNGGSLESAPAVADGISA